MRRTCYDVTSRDPRPTRHPDTRHPPSVLFSTIPRPYQDNADRTGLRQSIPSRPTMLHTKHGSNVSLTKPTVPASTLDWRSSATENTSPSVIGSLRFEDTLTDEGHGIFGSQATSYARSMCGQQSHWFASRLASAYPAIAQPDSRPALADLYSARTATSLGGFCLSASRGEASLTKCLQFGGL